MFYGLGSKTASLISDFVSVEVNRRSDIGCLEDLFMSNQTDSRPYLEVFGP